MKNRTLILLMTVLFGIQGSWLSGSENVAKQELSKEGRQTQAEKHEKMAEMHKKMADCMRSDKSMSECHEQMMKDCPMAKGGKCPMMEGMGMMKEMHGRGKGKRMNESTNDEKE